MDSQASCNETTDKGLEKGPEWQNVQKRHGEKCHDPARLGKIIGKWRESKGLATKPEKEARQAAACSDRPGTRPRRIRQVSEAPQRLEAKPVQDEPAREHGSTEARPPMSLEADMASASQDSWCGVS